jgi:uncharacterized membrane protein
MTYLAAISIFVILTAFANGLLVGVAISRRVLFQEHNS